MARIMIVAACALCMLGCGKQLAKDEATAQIKKQLNEGKGTICEWKFDLDIASEGYYYADASSAEACVRALDKHGMAQDVTVIAADGDKPKRVKFKTLGVFHMTDRGSARIGPYMRLPKGHLRFLCQKPDDVKVTSISTEGKKATVTYSWTMANLPIVEAVSAVCDGFSKTDQTFEGEKATFTLDDEGQWHLGT